MKTKKRMEEKTISESNKQIQIMEQRRKKKTEKG